MNPTLDLPAPGSEAPDFTLASTSNQPVTLSSFRGRQNVLIAFFPLAFTGTCSKQMQAFGDDLAQFEERNTAVLPISVDSTASLKEFKAKGKMPFDLLSDFKREVSRRYGVLLDDKFYSARAYVLVDKQGFVRWSWAETSNSDKRENAELLAEIGKLG